MIPLTPLEALTFLDKTLSQVRESRPVHDKIRDAVAIVQRALESQK